MTTPIALLGLGEIARSHHIPALQQSAQWQLAATVSRSTAVAGIENFHNVEELLAARPDIPVLSLCMPPAPRFEIASKALQAGRHIMLEKPPGATVSECRQLEQLAAQSGLTLFATWHSREAAVLDQCQQWLSDKQIKGFDITWKEDVRRWHAGQEWIWQPGGMGVFDPGINALSILTKILPVGVRVISAELETPSNRHTPIGARVTMATASGAVGSACFDWRQEGEQIWEIRITTDAGELQLTDGGAAVSINGEPLPAPLIRAPLIKSPVTNGNTLSDEYPRLYQRMHSLVQERASDCDFTPLQLVADAFMLARHHSTDRFEF
ncbi:Gfo/Idh/MocA family oxidoreductase [Aestuariicella hydrocarbonica]|uniref:Gfo/Idh/MocA family oxidoreductase n=1 Tax=Pseudomaricurvus hydrocarbonicus TaxID=1470433 RepID=A0A9E5JU43_9GAMM|nr:Gfo/Idh/MocA family oxidoreductase [Aestuariicella hydrocarbonica]NHO65623.1 Gfo/Idh/MocA family oxidoreductase [Aestuariicella hydrocarbonica]